MSERIYQENQTSRMGITIFLQAFERLGVDEYFIATSTAPISYFYMYPESSETSFL